MKSWKIEDLAGLGPSAIKQLEAQGVVFNRPEPVELDSKGNEFRFSDLEEVGFKNSVRAVHVNGLKTIDIGGGKNEFYQGKCIDYWYDNHSMTNGWIVYEFPFPEGHRIVTTPMSNIVRR